MIDIQKLIVFICATILLFYMLRLSSFTKQIWEFRTNTFLILIIGLACLTTATLLDLIDTGYNITILYHPVRLLFTIGSVIFIIGLILWSNYTKKVIDKFENLALTDSMTLTLNRKGIEKVFNSSAKLGKDLYFLVCDLNGTKKINDTLGHIKGDSYIIKSSEIINENIGNYGSLSRIGGDEFVILMQYIEPYELEAVIKKIKNLVELIYPDYATGISVGVSSFPKDGRDFETLLDVADHKMYINKKNYK